MDDLRLLAVLALLAGLASVAFLYRRVLAQERTIRRQMAREASLQARFDDLFERSSDVMVLHDPRGRITMMNRTGEQLCGYSRQEARMLDPARIFSRSYIDTIARLIEDGIEAEPRTVRAEMITRNSARVPIEAHARVLVGDHQMIGVTSVARNMAERDHFETQLRQAQKMQAVGRLASGIAHDFNNLITVLLGYSADLAEQIDHDSPLRPAIEEIRRAAERASGLTQQLLSFSRQRATSPQLIDMNAVVGNMKELLKRLLGAEIRLEVHLQGRPLPVQADSAQIGQIIMNLAVNARDAMPQGGTLTIATAAVTLGTEQIDVIPGEHVMLEVRDTGIGMAPDVQKQLFEPFFTTKASGHGTGLGLSMVQAIVRQSGGHITVDSEPGKGTTFRVYFPRASGKAADESATPAPSASSTQRGTGVILLAEDDRAVRRLMSADLRHRGFTVLEARDGAEALQICKQHRGDIHMLVTDVVMPVMNGVDLVAAAAPLRPDMKILFISGHPERAGVGLDPTSPHAMHNLLLKPFTPEVLAARVFSALQA